MITKTSGFLSRVGNIFKSEEEAITENRQEILGKYLVRENTNYDWGNKTTTITKEIVKDHMAINNFVKYYDDIMRQLKEIDKNANS